MTNHLQKSKLKGNMTKSKWAFFFATAFVVFALYFIFCVVPILQSVRMSFYDWAGMQRKTYIGFKNYVDVFKEPRFWRAFKNDLILTGIKEVVICFLTVLFAVSLTRFKMREGEIIFYKFVFYIPNVLSTVIIGLVWRFTFISGDQGLFNAILSLFSGGTDVAWLVERPASVIGFVASWCGVGLFMLTMMAAIHQVPSELYEAAKIDGASELQQLKYVTMPAVWLQLTFMIVSILYQSLGGNFALVNVMLPGQLSKNFEVMGLFVYKEGLDMSRYGYSYAASLVMLLITSVMSLSVKFFMDKAGDRE